MTTTLLIAEGDAALAEVYRKFFGQRGYVVETASDGLDCVEKLRRTRPAVLVLDRELQWGGGDGVLAWLRQETRMAAVAVILTATPACVPDGTEARQPPIVKFLPKPFSLVALLESVRAVCGTL